MIFVPPPFAADAIMEAADAGIRVIVAITEGIPVLDMVKVKAFLQDKPKSVLIGPNCPGIITPGECKIGIMPGYIHTPAGESQEPARTSASSRRSGTLTYEAVWQCTHARHRPDHLRRHRRRPGQRPQLHRAARRCSTTTPQTDAIIMIGEIGGTDEEAAAAFIKAQREEAVAAFIAGRTAPPGRRMGHAGAIISGGEGTAEVKIAALKDAGVAVAESPATIGEATAKLLGLEAPAAA